MAKVKIVVQPTGLLNGQPWPAEGKEVDLPDTVAEEMASAGWVKAMKVEKRAASSKKAAKKD